MTEVIIGVVGTLIALGAAATALAAHRHQVDQAVRSGVREQHSLVLAERAQIRTEDAERRDDLIQASLVDVDLSTEQSQLHGGWLSVHLVIANRSSHPIRDVTAWRASEQIPEVSGGLSPGSLARFPFPAVARDIDKWQILAEVQVEFTDAADNRWSRDHGGGLRRGIRAEDGAWQWGEREEPVILPARTVMIFGDGRGVIAEGDVQYHRSFYLIRSVRWALTVLIIVGLSALALWLQHSRLP
ncbi:hypothetical protein ACIHIX_35075 [Streptomyces sp. NPDC051913]|uniref:hypothetical protein n=1 Tax=Streptomyces sp. NPDC051913 TaxID=3365676 RepID=UPI0037D85A6B